MLLSFFLLFILCESTVKSLTSTTWPQIHSFTTEISTTTNAVTVEAAENLGVAAFFFSLLALIINFAILFWLGWQRFGPTQTSSNTAAKGFPGPEKSSKGGVQQTEMDGDVYMNYTNTSQDYTDLDPSNATVDNVYSSLS
ncbi:hypothetical protein ABVT39_022660 [Epinephelus coioides]